MTNWGPIGREVYERTYSRIKDDGSHETWDETVERVVDGNLALAPEWTQMPDERERLIHMISNFEMMPAGRHLWVSGVEGKQFLFNCHRAGWSHGSNKWIAHYRFMFDQLMCGGGVGANYTDAPAVTPLHSQLTFGQSRAAIVVEDSREGWVCALGSLLASHSGGLSVEFDVTQIRGAGERLKGFGGVASGPAPLVRMLRQVNTFLNERAGCELAPLDHMELDHYIAACVIAGNVRRSARMSILNWDHPDILPFIHCKGEDGLHWTTNISVGVDDDFWAAVASRDTRARTILTMIAAGMRKNGEPGIVNLSRVHEGERGDVSSTNPCGEIALEDWEPCNLGHVNMAAAGNRIAAAELMARFLVRATLSPDIHPYQRDVLHRNRRIGVGLYGFQEWLLRRGIKYSDVARWGEVRRHIEYQLGIIRHHTKLAADDLCADLGIPHPIKYTTIAPTGTISLLSGHTAGIHPVAAKQFIRRVRYSDNDPALEAFPASMVEPDVYSSNTAVVSMLCEDSTYAQHGDLVEDAHDLGIHEQLRVQKLFQEHWADNAVSYTVALPEGVTQESIANMVRMYGPRLKGMTMFPQLSRAQQPIERLSEDEYQRLSAIMRSETSQAEVDCVNGACPVK